MKYVVLVSHGKFAPGLHSALDMLAGEGREDILSASFENGMSSEVYADNFKKCLEAVTLKDEILLLGDLVDMLIPEAREELKEFQATSEEAEGEI